MSISMISKIPVSPFIITVTVVLIFPAAMRLGSDAIVMEILFHLINHFSYQLPASQIPGTAKNQERLQEILLYVEENYRHPILHHLSMVPESKEVCSNWNTIFSSVPSALAYFFASSIVTPAHSPTVIRSYFERTL